MQYTNMCMHEFKCVCMCTRLCSTSINGVVEVGNLEKEQVSIIIKDRKYTINSLFAKA